MSENLPPDERWRRVARQLNAINRPADPAEATPPHGFATRVVAAARTRAGTRAGHLHRWRRACLAGAACTLALFLTVRLTRPETGALQSQFIPLPEFELPAHLPD